MRDETTYHLTPVEVWSAQAAGQSYVPEAFESEGFIHCTDGRERVIEVGNRYYTGDPRPFCVLQIDRKLIEARTIYEDQDEVYPHIYGALNIDAVRAVLAIVRDIDGRFLEIGDLLP